MAAHCKRFQYFYGVLPHTKYICIYDTLLEKSSAEEIEAILAHELGHWAHSDPTKLLVLSQVQIITIMSLFTLFINNASLFRAFGFQQATNTIAGKLQSTVQRALHKQTTVQVAYLPIVVGLELFQMVLHPLDSLGMSPLSCVSHLSGVTTHASRQPSSPVKFCINAAVRRMEYAADE